MKKNLRMFYNDEFWRGNVKFIAPESGSFRATEPKYEEMHETFDCLKRGCSLRNHMNDLIRKESADGKRVCLLVVSHGLFAAILSEIFQIEQQLTSENKYKTYEALLKVESKKMVNRLKEVENVLPGLCSIHGYEVTGGKTLSDYKMGFYRDDEHVQQLRASTQAKEKKSKKKPAAKVVA